MILDYATPRPAQTHSEVERDAEVVFQGLYQKIARRTDRMFAWLMVLQWIGAVVLAFTLSPRTYVGLQSEPHVHVATAIVVGGALTAIPLWMIWRHPGTFATRMTVGAIQMLWSGLLIHLSGGRLETHFHIFGSLALLAFYRDLRVLIPATLVTGADHFLRGALWPESIYGVANPEWWRFLEHGAWVHFMDIFLVLNCKQSLEELRRQALREVLVRDATEKASAAREQVARAEERERAAKEREATQKLEAIGQLAAGIAHEINTPIQYVGDNTVFVGSGVDRLLQALAQTQELIAKCEAGTVDASDAKMLRRKLKKSKVGFLEREIPKALQQSVDGLQQVATIVRALKEFSHPSEGVLSDVNLEQAIQATLTVARNEWKYVAEVVTEFDEALPTVPAVRDELNQVVLNLVVNAAHAIGDRYGPDSDTKGEIRVTTRRAEPYAEIRVSDDGGGIPEAIRRKIFEPFFTTKEVGQGTGQGLSLARTVIVKKHGGTLDVESEVGVGTTFIIRLPLEQETLQRDEAA